MAEQWKRLDSPYTRYEVSTDGRVRDQTTKVEVPQAKDPVTGRMQVELEMDDE